MTQCGGSINIMVAKEKIKEAKQARDREAVSAAQKVLATARAAHRKFTGCTEDH